MAELEDDDEELPDADEDDNDEDDANDDEEEYDENYDEESGSGLGLQPRYVIYLVKLGLNRIGHMSFLTGQDRTPKFAGQVLADRTESGLIFLNILTTR